MHILDWSKLIFKFKKLKIQNLFQLVIPNYYPEYLKYHTFVQIGLYIFSWWIKWPADLDNMIDFNGPLTSICRVWWRNFYEVEL